MKLEDIFQLWNFVFGLCAMWFASRAVNWLMKKIEKVKNFHPPSNIDPKIWEEAFEYTIKTNQILGIFEALFSYISFACGKPELIAGWLTFKLASKWQTWTAIMRIPERIENINDVEYIGAKNKIASYTLHRWLIGTLGNLLAGAIGVGVGLKIPHFLGVILILFVVCDMVKNYKNIIGFESDS